MSAWHFTEGSDDTVFTAWDCITGDFLTGDAARKKMAEDGGVAVSVMDADRRRWWATSNPEKANGLKWWALPTPDDAPMSGPVSPFRGGWKDYSVCGEVDEGLTDEERTVLYGNTSVAKPQGVMTVDANGKVVKTPHMPFVPAGASPLSEKGYDVTKERTIDENTEKTKAIGVTDTGKAIRLIDAYGKWCGVEFPKGTLVVEFEVPYGVGPLVLNQVDQKRFDRTLGDSAPRRVVKIDLNARATATMGLSFGMPSLPDLHAVVLLSDTAMQQLIDYFEKNTNA